jgi:hypothetical protein
MYNVEEIQSEYGADKNSNKPIKISVIVVI